MSKAAKEVIKAWESLPEGYYSGEELSEWLIKDMKPAIDLLRKSVKKAKPL